MIETKSLFKYRKYFLVFLIAWLVRILFFVQWSHTPYAEGLVVDAKAFDAWAVQIAQGEWAPRQVFYQAPVYAYFLAIIYKIFGHHPALVSVIQTLSGSLSCVMFVILGDAIWGAPVGVVAGLLAAFYRPFIFTDSLILKSTWDIFFSLLFLLYAIRTQKNALKKDAFLTGLLLGICILLRGNMIFFVPFVPIGWFFLKQFDKSYKTLLVLFYLIGVSLPILPMTLSNYVTGKDFILLTSTGGITFWVGNNPQATGHLNLPANIDVYSITQDEEKYFKSIAESEVGRTLKPSEISKFWSKKAWNYIFSQPLSWSKLMFKKFLLFWNHYEIPDNYNLTFIQKEFKTVLSYPLVSFGLIAPLSLIGIFLMGKDKYFFWLIVGLGTIYMGTVILFMISDRYRLPVVTYLMPLAAYTLVCLFKDLKSKNRSRLITYAAVAPVSLILCWMPIINPLVHFSDAQEQLGYLYYLQKNYDKAMEYYQQAAQLNPNSGFVYHNMGVACYERGDYITALQFYKKAIEINPKYVETYNNLGLIYTQIKQYDDAIEAYRKVVQLNPNFSLAYFNLGTIYREKGNYKDAIQCYFKAIEISPNSIESYINLGSLYAQLKDFEHALQVFKKATGLNSNLAGIYYNMALIYTDQKNYPQAIEFYHKAIEIAPHFIQSYINLGRLYSQNQQYEQAKQVYEKAVETAPNFPELYEHLGNTYYFRKEYGKALIIFQKMSELVPGNPAIQSKIKMLEGLAAKTQ